MNQSNQESNVSSSSPMMNTNLYAELREAKEAYEKATEEADRAFKHASKFPDDETIKLAVQTADASIEAVTMFLQARQNLVEWQRENDPKNRC